MYQSCYAPRPKWWCLLHRWPGPVRSGSHQRALRECRGRDQQCGAERRLLCRRHRPDLPRHPSGEPLRSPSVALLHHLSARPHPAPQQPGLQHGQSGGARGSGRSGAGSEGHGRGPHLRPLYRQQYGIPRLPHQPRLMAGRDGPFPVLNLKHVGRSLLGYDKTDSQGFLHFFLSPSKTDMFCDVGWRTDGREEVWLLVSQQSWRRGNGRVEMCSLEKSSEEHLHATEYSVSTLCHTTFLITWLYFVLSLSENETGSSMSVDYAHRGGNVVSFPQNKPTLSNSYNARATI